MGGMIGDWRGYSDPLNDISRPSQMGPQWVEVSRSSGMPIDARIWALDPPASSYPACVAVKAAERQGAALGERYLRRLRAAVMLERRNIARREVLVALAQELAAAPAPAHPALAQSARLDAARWLADLDGSAALDAFREDVKTARFYDIGRFPTLVLRPREGRAAILVGYRPYDALRDALAHVAPHLEPVRALSDPVDYVRCWGCATAEEVALALDAGPEAADAALAAAVADGTLARASTSPLVYCAA